MYKKILALILAMLMVAGMLISCSGEEEEDDEAADSSTRVSMTLSLWLPTDEETTDEAIALVEDAINDITKAKFDTAIELHAIPRDEYQAAIDARMAEIEEKVSAEDDYYSDDEDESQTEVEEETIVNELGISVTKYPEVGDKQMDIFLVQGYDKYSEYVENEQILSLDNELGSESKILRSYIYPTFLELAGLYGTYAIPNNHPVGSYSYLLANKELVDKYDYHPDDFTSILKCEDFIVDMGYQNLEGVIPLLGYVEPANMVFWGSEDNEWSLIASQITNSSTYNSQNIPKSIFTLNVYTNTVKLMKSLDELGYVGDGTLEEGEKFAIGVIEGDPISIKEYEDDYYIRVYSNPMFTEDDVFGAMFAVSKYTKNLSRSMEIITYLNTNTELRTVLQYGVEGVHWEFENPEAEELEKTIRILSDDYRMNLLETGNVYMTYPAEGRPRSEWEAGKQQNLDSISSPYIGFPDYITEENKELVAELQKLSAQIKAELDACPSADYTALVRSLTSSMKDNELLNELLSEEITHSFRYIYDDWFSSSYS